MTNSSDNNQLFHLVIRVPKKESAFTYFTLESNEGLCFYSTLEDSMGQGHRDIELTAHISLKEELEALLNNLEKSIPIEYLVKEIIEDKAN
jgi:hypothetical protein